MENKTFNLHRLKGLLSIRKETRLRIIADVLERQNDLVLLDGHDQTCLVYDHVSQAVDSKRHAETREETSSSLCTAGLVLPTSKYVHIDTSLR